MATPKELRTVEEGKREDWQDSGKTKGDKESGTTRTPVRSTEGRGERDVRTNRGEKSCC